jgi:hypothetical protein
LRHKKSNPFGLHVNKKMASTSHHAAQPITLAVFRPWGDSSGAGCVRLAAAKVRRFIELRKFFEQKKTVFAKKNRKAVFYIDIILLFTIFV